MRTGWQAAGRVGTGSLQAAITAGLVHEELICCRASHAGLQWRCKRRWACAVFDSHVNFSAACLLSGCTSLRLKPQTPTLLLHSLPVPSWVHLVSVYAVTIITLWVRVRHAGVTHHPEHIHLLAPSA